MMRDARDARRLLGKWFRPAAELEAVGCNLIAVDIISGAAKVLYSSYLTTWRPELEETTSARR